LLDARDRLVGRLLGREAIDDDAVHGRAQAREFALPLKAGLALLAVLVVLLAVDRQLGPVAINFQPDITALAAVLAVVARVVGGAEFIGAATGVNRGIPPAPIERDSEPSIVVAAIGNAFATTTEDATQQVV
jgi:hypothetical protein